MYDIHLTQEEAEIVSALRDPEKQKRLLEVKTEKEAIA